jgi:uncharacterized protein YndB with AHSA1/START domain
MTVEDSKRAAPTSGVRPSPALRRASGRDRAEWFELMGAWGAVGRPYREIADWLTVEHGLSAWWAQKLIVEYEQLRGVRKPGVRRDGSFSVGASRSIAAPVERAYAAFIDPGIRERWLPGVELRVRTARPDRAARFDWEDGATRIGVTFAASDQGRCDVAVEHERLKSRVDADQAQAFWKDHLGTLKGLLETGEKPVR